MAYTHILLGSKTGYYTTSEATVAAYGIKERYASRVDNTVLYSTYGVILEFARDPPLPER